MVVFTCNHCGDSLQKPKVAKHYDTTCRRNPINLTCVDCFTDFKLQEYVAHTKCCTEEDRYSAKGTASKILKGELKQNEWVKTVNLIIEQQKTARPGIKNILQGLVKYDNIPRKKVKFLNFAKNAFGFKVNERDVEEVWDILEAHKNSVNKSKQEGQNGGGEIKEQGKTENLGESADKKSKKKRKKSESEGTVENGTNDGINTEIKDQGTTENLDTNQEKKSKKKKKKSESEGTGENGIEQEQKKPENLDESNQDNKSKKKKKKSESEGTVENGINELKPENLDESNQDKKSKKKKKSEETVENGIEQAQEKPENLDESNQDKKSKKKKKKSVSEETMETATNGVETSEDITKKKRKSKEPVAETINGAEESPQKKQKLNETSEENEADLSSKKKKKKKSLPDDETPQKKQKLDETSETNDSKQNDSQNESFSFKEVITEILTKKSKGLSKEALQNKVFKKYEAIMGPVENMEILLKKYNKKIKNTQKH